MPKTTAEIEMIERKRRRNGENRRRSRQNILRQRREMTLIQKQTTMSQLEGLAISRGLSLRECGTLDYCRNRQTQTE